MEGDQRNMESALNEALCKGNEINEDFAKTAIRVSKVSIIGNAVLSLLKLLAGIFAHSGAMVSDAVHSASDVVSSIVVIIGVRMASKESDAEHQYGHERMESVAAVVLAMLLCITGLFIGYTAIENLRIGEAGKLQIPGVPALIAAIISIGSKEAMYWYTRYYAKRLDSGALMADAWHHRSDALSSIGSLIGIAGARMGHPWLDPAASLVICLFIIKAAYDIFVDAIQKMVDHACSEELQQEILDCAKAQSGVCGIANLQTREFGSRIYVDLEVLADGNLTLAEGNEIAERVHDSIEETFPKIKHIVVIMRPDNRQVSMENGMRNNGI